MENQDGGEIGVSWEILGMSGWNPEQEHSTQQHFVVGPT